MNVRAITPIAIDDDRVILSRADYDAMVDDIETAADIAAALDEQARIASGESETVPVAVVKRMMTGEHPVRVWREHRGIGLRALAAAAGTSPGYLSEIESGRKPGSLATMAALARALDVDLDELVPWTPPPLPMKRVRGAHS